MKMSSPVQWQWHRLPNHVTVGASANASPVTHTHTMTILYGILGRWPRTVPYPTNAAPARHLASAPFVTFIHANYTHSSCRYFELKVSAVCSILSLRNSRLRRHWHRDADAVTRKEISAPNRMPVIIIIHTPTFKSTPKLRRRCSRTRHLPVLRHTQCLALRRRHHLAAHDTHGGQTDAVVGAQRQEHHRAVRLVRLQRLFLNHCRDVLGSGLQTGTRTTRQRALVFIIIATGNTSSARRNRNTKRHHRRDSLRQWWCKGTHRGLERSVVRETLLRLGQRGGITYREDVVVTRDLTGFTVQQRHVVTDMLLPTSRRESGSSLTKQDSNSVTRTWKYSFTRARPDASRAAP